MARKTKDNTTETKSTNGAGTASASEVPEAAAASEGAMPQLDPEVVKKVTALRSYVRESFGKVVMAMMMMPRYRHQTIGDLQHLVLEPLIRDRIAIAYPGEKDSAAGADIVGLAIWASVSEEVDAGIRDQIRAGTFPLRLKPDDWTSGSINWLIDVIAPDEKTTTRVLANFKQVVKEGSLRLHPLITRLVDEETLKKMGAEKIGTPPAA
ncbi:MAG TPA: toxin-activating lysine-acyltransferase [Allosphingosinicella sp.]|jgi:hemolysin-activating ACP:hemolysin acyltransferase